MSIPKVYLAKSNKANPDVVSRVRQDLSKFDVEIVEFSGGTYTHKPLLECNLLIVVPDLTNDNIIGKGLYEQINLFSEKNDFEDVLVVTDFSKNQIFVDLIEDLYVDDSNDYVNYGVLSVSGGKEKLIDTLEDAYYYTMKRVSDSLVQTTENDYQYLLIKSLK
jgi:hypothetical protein